MSKLFDFSFANPPYGNDKDLNIMLETFKVTKKKLVFVMTAGFLIDLDKASIRNDLNNYCEYISLFNGNKVFKIDFYDPLCIIVLNKNKDKKKDIIIEDDYYSKSTYTLSNLNKFSRLGKLSDEVLENEKQVEKNLRDRNIITKTYSNMKRALEQKDVGKFVLRISKGISGVFDRQRVADIVIPKGQKNIAQLPNNFVSSDLNFFIPPSKESNEFPKTGYDTVFDTFEDANTVNETYKQPIFRYLIQKEKTGHNISADLVDLLPWPADENGKIKYLTGEELKKKLGMCDELYNAIIRFYSLEHNKNYD